MGRKTEGSTFTCFPGLGPAERVGKEPTMIRVHTMSGQMLFAIGHDATAGEKTRASATTS